MAKDTQDLRTWLPSIALFGGLEEGTLKKVIGMLGEHHFEPGTEVCKQGEAGRAMFLVRHGEVMVCRDDDDGTRRKLIRLGPGEFFGEMTLIDIQKRSATVIVEKPALVFSLGNRDLFKLYQEDVAGYVMILQNLCRELSRRLRVTNNRLQSLASEVDDEPARTLIRPAIKT
ncbi:MAG: cyclic nucleotide-binding domain-containing protein [Myxococcaceae bacterium]|nr:cyclic nucleotide-binding domain-containing protein [Myxococcaceae bacterium]